MMEQPDVFSGVGVVVKLANQEAFLKIRETLTRIGIASKKDEILYQSCHILHKRGQYAIVHFKELFLLDGKQTDITESDLARRDTIAKILEQWGLVTIVHPDEVSDTTDLLNQIKVLKFNEKNDWQLVAKYNIGHKR